MGSDMEDPEADILSESLLPNEVSNGVWTRRMKIATLLVSLSMCCVVLLSSVPFSSKLVGERPADQDPGINMAGFERMFFGGGGFPGMGGMPGMGGQQPQQKKKSDNTRFYKLLGIDKSASEAEVKKAFRKLAMKEHPDKGGDPEKFKDITKAYEILADPEKRKQYDEGGEDGLSGSGADPSDIFDQLFGGGRKGKKGKKGKTEDIVQPIKVTLEQMYLGATKKMAITRQVIDKERGVTHCNSCDGKGVKVQVVRMGVMIQQMQSACDACGGQGKSFRRKSEREVLEIYINKGAPKDHKVIFREKADEQPDHDTGDVIFILKEQDHKTFKRRNADLFIEKTISLVEALCGFEIEVEHLDGRKLLIKTSPGDIVCPAPGNFDPLSVDQEKPLEWECMEGFDCPAVENVAQADTTDVETLKKAIETQLKQKGISVGAFVVDGRRAYFKSATREDILKEKKPRHGCTMYVVTDPNAGGGMRMIKAVKGEGMPTLRDPTFKGNLFLLLTIQFPDKIASDAQEKLKAILPPPLNKAITPADDLAEVFVEDMDPVKSFRENKGNMKSGDAYDEDEDDDRGGIPGMQGGAGGPGVQCAQQ